MEVNFHSSWIAECKLGQMCEVVFHSVKQLSVRSIQNFMLEWIHNPSSSSMLGINILSAQKDAENFSETADYIVLLP